MTYSPRIAAAIANAMLDAGIGTVSDNGKLKIYDGAQPTNGGDAVTGQHLLVTLTLGSDAFPAAAAGVLTANAITPGVAVYSSTATWFRLTKSDGTTVLLDGSVGTTGCDLNIASTTITITDVIAATSMTIGEPLA